jgi:threonine synthase
MARIKGIQIDGFKELYQKMGLLEEEIDAAAIKGVRKLANVILGESQKLVPVETGTLKNSGTVSLDKKNKIATISYNTPYARKQHEDNTLKHPRGGQAKYLERPFNEKSDELETYVGNEIDKVLRRK